MSNSLSASTQGLEIVEKARQRRGWTKTSTACWWQDAHTSRATLRRFWQGERIQRDIFIAICQAVGINNWEAIAESSDVNFEPLQDFSNPYNIDWNETPDLEGFYGRDRELEQLENWITNDGYKLVTIVGMAGIGKTALALALADRLQSKFDRLIWRSLQSNPSLNSLLDGIFKSINKNDSSDPREGIKRIIIHLKQRPTLLILDGMEAVWSKEEFTGEYSYLIQQLHSEIDRSCIIITSREKLHSLMLPIICENKVDYFYLNGLRKSDALKLWRSRGFTGKEIGLSALIQMYRGNPLAIELVIPLIESVFAGNIAAFLNQNTLVIGDRLRNILKQQFDRLSDLERDILYWLAIWQEPISLCRLQTHFLISIDPAAVWEGIATLEGRSLLEKWFSGEEFLFTLQPLVMKMVTDELVECVGLEIDRVMQNKDIRHFQILRTHWLVRPGTDDIAGDRILTQLRERLWRVYGATLPETLQEILLLLNDRSPLAIGYIGCNMMAILKSS